MMVRSPLQVVLLLAFIFHSRWVSTMANPITALHSMGRSNRSSNPALNVPQYRFQYAIHNERTGNFKSQEETHDGETVHGSYTVAEPNGDLRVVTYTANMDNGFQAMVNVKPGGLPRPHVHTQRSLQDYNVNIPILQTREPSLGVTFGIPIVKAQQHSTGTTISVPTTVIQPEKSKFDSETNRHAVTMLELKLSNVSNISSEPSVQQKTSNTQRSISSYENNKPTSQTSNAENVFLREKLYDIIKLDDTKNNSLKFTPIQFEFEDSKSIVNTTNDKSNQTKFHNMRDMTPKGIKNSSQINVQNSDIKTQTVRDHVQDILLETGHLKDTATNMSTITSSQKSLQFLPSGIQQYSQHQRQNNMTASHLKSQESPIKPIYEIKEQQSIRAMLRNAMNEETRTPKIVKNNSISEILDGNPNLFTNNSSIKELEDEENIEETLKSLFLASPDALKAVGIDPQSIEFGPGSLPMMERLMSDNSRLKIVQTSPQHTTRTFSVIPSQPQEPQKKNGQYLLHSSETRYRNESSQGTHRPDSNFNFSQTTAYANAQKYPSSTVLLQDTFQAQLNPTSTLQASPEIPSQHATAPQGKSLFFTDTMQHSARTKIKSLQQHLFPNIGYRGMSGTSTLQNNFFNYPLGSALSYFRFPVSKPIPQQRYSEPRPVIQYPIIHHRYFPQYPHIAFMQYTPSLAVVRTIVVPVSDMGHSQKQ